ncbi:conserved hypothetical protein [Brucella sp. F5/99]|nr:conserved hypothetical protein [Brucella sp. F5/99]
MIGQKAAKMADFRVKRAFFCNKHVAMAIPPLCDQSCMNVVGSIFRQGRKMRKVIDLEDLDAKLSRAGRGYEFRSQRRFELSALQQSAGLCRSSARCRRGNPVGRRKAG